MYEVSSVTPYNGKDSTVSVNSVHCTGVRKIALSVDRGNVVWKVLLIDNFVT